MGLPGLQGDVGGLDGGHTQITACCKCVNLAIIIIAHGRFARIPYTTPPARPPV